MTKVITTQIGADGVLHLALPLDKADACKAVRVTVETVESIGPITDRADWLRFIKQTAGSIPDPTFERPPQEPVQERDLLS